MLFQLKMIVIAMVNFVNGENSVGNENVKLILNHKFHYVMEKVRLMKFVCAKTTNAHSDNIVLKGNVVIYQQLVLKMKKIPLLSNVIVEACIVHLDFIVMMENAMMHQKNHVS